MPTDKFVLGHFGADELKVVETLLPEISSQI